MEGETHLIEQILDEQNLVGYLRSSENGEEGTSGALERLSMLLFMEAYRNSFMIPILHYF